MSIGNLKDYGNKGNNFPWQLKMLQGLQAIADATSAPLTCVEDSVTICNTNIDAFTFTNIAGNDALNVNIAGGVALTVNLDAADDSVQIYGSNLSNPIVTDVSGVLAIQDNGGSITVDANNLDIRDLAFATDKVDVSGSSVTISDGSGPVTVDGTVELGASTLSALESITVQNPGGASAVNIQDGGNSITVDGGTGVSRTPNAIRPTNTSGTVTGTIYSISVANVGAANGTVLTALTTIKPGEVLNFSADAINNFFTSFDYNATGTEFIIIYVS